MSTETIHFERRIERAIATERKKKREIANSK
jgi:hypothetical protein